MVQKHSVQTARLEGKSQTSPQQFKVGREERKFHNLRKNIGHMVHTYKKKKDTPKVYCLSAPQKK